MGNINLTTLFNSLGIVGGNTASNNQYEFFNGVEWNDNTFTYNQYEFFKKVAGSRYDFFKNYNSERDFYNSIDDERIYDFYTFYKYAGEYLKGSFVDLFGTPFGAYSIRKLNNSYTGPCLRVRKSSTEQDINFNGGMLNIQELMNFTGSQNLFTYSEDISTFSITSVVTIQDETNETLDPFGGNKAAKITGTSGNWLVREALASIVSGQTYNISLWVKSVNPTTQNTFRFIIGTNSSVNITANGEWVRYSVNIVANGTSTGILRDTSANISNLYIYGFQISKGTQMQNYTSTNGSINLGNANVVKIYDQIGNNDAVQTISESQPIIVEGGVLKVDENGLPAPYFDGVDDFFNNVVDISGVEDFIILSVNQLDEVIGTNNRSFLGSVNNSYFRYNTSNNLEFRFRNSNFDNSVGTIVSDQIVASTASNTRIVAAYNYNTATFSSSNSTNSYQLTVRENDFSDSIVSSVLDTYESILDIGTRTPSASADWFKGYISEIIYYKGDEKIYKSDFSIDTDGWLSTNATISATNSSLRFVADGTNGQHFTRLEILNNNKKYKITGEVYIPSTNILVNSVRIWDSTASDGIITIAQKDTWVPFNMTIISSGSINLRLQAYNNTLASFVGNNLDYFDMRGITVDEIDYDMKEKVSKIGDMIDNINSFYEVYQP